MIRIETIKLTWRFLASSRMVFWSVLRSFLFPTSIIGTLGQKCFTSGTLQMITSKLASNAKNHCFRKQHLFSVLWEYSNRVFLLEYFLFSSSFTKKGSFWNIYHFSGIFSRESGESTEKHMRITWVSGYDNGLNLS